MSGMDPSKLPADATIISNELDRFLHADQAELSPETGWETCDPGGSAGLAQQSDPLTGLLTRSMLQQRLEWTLAECRRSGEHLTVLCLDLDRFKYINDTLGQSVGDELLRQVGARLIRLVSENDTVARVGGDAFLMLLRDAQTPQAAAKMALKVGHALHTPYLIDQESLVVTCSIGISLYPENGADAEALLQHADTAMYRAKQGGRNRYVFYQSAMTREVSAQFALQKALTLALQRDEFVMHYQPQICLRTGTVTGAEALIRWHHPERGLTGPDHFIPAAEENGLIRAIGEWVIRKVGADMQQWREDGLPAIRFALNLSALQIARPQHADALCALLRAAGMAHRQSGMEIEVELTESSLMTGDHARASIHALKALGLSLAIDDFGTGYSSLAALQKLPIDCLKIDRSFVVDLPGDANACAMASAIIAMGRALGLRLLAEGVEKPVQLEFLRGQGCDEAQGFLFSPALPIAGLREYVTQTR